MKKLSYKQKKDIDSSIFITIIIAGILGFTSGNIFFQQSTAVGFIIFLIVEYLISIIAQNKINRGNVDLDSWYYVFVHPGFRRVDKKLKEQFS